ncbi:unnamed protein product [Paramecium octaurelia]|uniref:Uncharacterized protein n=1 Tax=Paramecium octaurelia TaxID=43137 RepID=A0A8S1SKL6_PAROT|nr:unnamed protein product [Paramecium octaurelia]
MQLLSHIKISQRSLDYQKIIVLIIRYLLTILTLFHLDFSPDFVSPQLLQIPKKAYPNSQALYLSQCHLLRFQSFRFSSYTHRQLLFVLLPLNIQQHCLTDSQ